MLAITEIDLLNFLKEGGGYAIAILVVAGFVRGWIVPGWIYKEKAEECEAKAVESRRWQEITIRGMQTVGAAVDTAHEVTGK